MRTFRLFRVIQSTMIWLIIVVPGSVACLRKVVRPVLRDFCAESVLLLLSCVLVTANEAATPCWVATPGFHRNERHNSAWAEATPMACLALRRRWPMRDTVDRKEAWADCAVELLHAVVVHACCSGVVANPLMAIAGYLAGPGVGTCTRVAPWRSLI